jgi:hypothetical protein
MMWLRARVEAPDLYVFIKVGERAVERQRKGEYSDGLQTF